MDKKLDKNTDKNTRALKLENVSVKGGIVTATCLTPRVKVGNEITLGVDENTKLECKVNRIWTANFFWAERRR